MEKNQLKEFRCHCGRLLCRGYLISSFIEIKCKKCGAIYCFNDDKEKMPISFTIKTDLNGEIIETCRMALLLVDSQENLVGKNIKDLFNVIGAPKKEAQTIAINDDYKPRSLEFLGNKIKVESCLLEMQNNEGKIDSYQVFGKLFS